MWSSKTGAGARFQLTLSRNASTAANVSQFKDDKWARSSDIAYVFLSLMMSATNMGDYHLETAPAKLLGAWNPSFRTVNSVARTSWRERETCSYLSTNRCGDYTILRESQFSLYGRRKATSLAKPHEIASNPLKKHENCWKITWKHHDLLKTSSSRAVRSPPWPSASCLPPAPPCWPRSGSRS